MKIAPQSFGKTSALRPVLLLTLVGGICGVMGLAHMYGKNKYAKTRTEIAEAFEKIEGLKREITLAEQQMAELLGRASLEERLERGGSELRPIQVGTVVPVLRVEIARNSNGSLEPRRFYNSTPKGAQKESGLAMHEPKGGASLR